MMIQKVVKTAEADVGIFNSEVVIHWWCGDGGEVWVRIILNLIHLTFIVISTNEMWRNLNNSQ